MSDYYTLESADTDEVIVASSDYEHVMSAAATERETRDVVLRTWSDWTQKTLTMQKVLRMF